MLMEVDYVLYYMSIPFLTNRNYLYSVSQSMVIDFCVEREHHGDVLQKVFCIS